MNKTQVLHLYYKPTMTENISQINWLGFYYQSLPVQKD